LVDAHRGAGPIWGEALRRSGLADRGEVHGGAVSRAPVLHLVPGSVTEGAYGERIPEYLQAYADYVGWARITQDGSWGRYARIRSCPAATCGGSQNPTSREPGGVSAT